MIGRHAPAPTQFQMRGIGEVHPLYFLRVETTGRSIQAPDQPPDRAVNLDPLGQNFLAAIVPNAAGGSFECAQARSVFARLDDNGCLSALKFSCQVRQILLRRRAADEQNRPATQSRLRDQDRETV